MSLKHHSCGTSPNSKYVHVPLTIPMHVQDGSFVCETTYTRRFTTNSNKIDPSQWDTNKLCSQTVAYYAAIKRPRELGVVMHTFSSSTLRTEASRSLSLRSVWSRLGVPGQLGLQNETLFPNKTKRELMKTILHVLFSVKAGY